MAVQKLLTKKSVDLGGVAAFKGLNSRKNLGPRGPVNLARESYVRIDVIAYNFEEDHLKTK